MSLPKDCDIGTGEKPGIKTSIPSASIPVMIGLSPIQLETTHMEALDEFGDAEDEDQAFIYYLLDAHFDKEELRISSYGGSRSNYNGTSHEQLDETVMKFIEGKTMQNRKMEHISTFLYPGLFQCRVKGDIRRFKKLASYVNRKYNNLRRAMRGVN